VQATVNSTSIFGIFSPSSTRNRGSCAVERLPGSPSRPPEVEPTHHLRFRMSLFDNSLQGAGDRTRTGDVQLGKLSEANGFGAQPANCGLQTPCPMRLPPGNWRRWRCSGPQALDGARWATCDLPPTGSAKRLLVILLFGPRPSQSIESVPSMLQTHAAQLLFFA
jgi:hypothetical protein